jgi:hypothetical protein
LASLLTARTRQSEYPNSNAGWERTKGVANWPAGALRDESRFSGSQVAEGVTSDMGVMVPGDKVELPR